ncbi:MAG: gamma-glutamyltransferase family protein, partial [Chloroflexi bacterium]|nr:gamma-glutamyltransferase family protein [Chloroflexota bacterium]
MAHTFGTPAYSSDGVVAAPHYLAALAGVNVLRDGGSAVDAALATNFVLAVVWPHMCGPGGDLFAQVWSPSDGRLFAFNASGRAGAAMTVDAYHARGIKSMPQRGPLSVTVPGAIDGWFELHRRWGRLEMDRLTRDAAHLARDGFRLTSFTAGAIAGNAELLARNGGGAEVFLRHGNAPRAGDRLVQPDLAKTFELLARDGPQVFYRGELCERVLEFLAQRGGGLNADDFASQSSEWVEPIGVEYRGVRVCQVPPNSQGIALLETLNIIGELDLRELTTGERLHQLVERKKLAFADRDACVADPRCADVPTERLLDSQHAAERARRVDGVAIEHTPGPRQPADGDTIYLCAADRDGMVVSWIQSLYAAFGSGVHVPGTGVTLHNRGFGFVLTPGHPNALAAGKRPLHTLMPGFAQRGGQPWLAFGTRGADGQPQTGLQILTGL